MRSEKIMKSRYIKNIKVKGNRLRFEHSDIRYECSYTSDSVEAIYFNGHILRFNSSESGKSAHACDATEKDFEILKKLLSTSQNFVKCGENYIFSLENITSYDENENTLNVCCKNHTYKVSRLNKELIKEFVETVRSRLSQNEEVLTND